MVLSCKAFFHDTTSHVPLAAHGLVDERVCLVIADKQLGLRVEMKHLTVQSQCHRTDVHERAAAMTVLLVQRGPSMYAVFPPLSYPSPSSTIWQPSSYVYVILRHIPTASGCCWAASVSTFTGDVLSFHSMYCTGSR